MSVRMQDIAEQLGLSISTVSLALRSAPQVAQETRVRVIDAAEQLGYVVRPRPQRSMLTHVAFVTREDAGNEFYGSVLSGAESECRRLGLSLHFTQIDEQAPVRQMNYQLADGLLAVGNLHETTVREMLRFELPTVLVDNNLPLLNIDRILIENVQSLYRTTRYAYQQGHRAIAFLCGPLDNSSFNERRIGYRAAIADLGLQPTELYFQHGDASDVGQTLLAWREQHRDFGFTALIGCNDKSSIRAFHTLHDHGLRVPQDVSLLGFDDVELASVIRPALTTNRVPRELLGRLGVQRLVERARDPGMPPLGLTVETALIERDSVGPPGRAV